MRSGIRLLARVLQIAGVLALGYAAFFFVRAVRFQEHEREILQQTLQSRARRPAADNAQNGAPREPEPAAPELDSLIGRIEVPRLHLTTMVIEGVEDRELKLGAGHMPGSALPGRNGNVVIAAHRDTFFRPLRKIKENDEIDIVTTDGTYRYVVDSLQVTNPKNVSVLQASLAPELTLITCYPFSYIGSAPDRFIVHARKVE